MAGELALVGAGSLGQAFAGLLARSGQPVTLLATPETLGRLRGRGRDQAPGRRDARRAGRARARRPRARSASPTIPAICPAARASCSRRRATSSGRRPLACARRGPRPTIGPPGSAASRTAWRKTTSSPRSSGPRQWSERSPSSAASVAPRVRSRSRAWAAPTSARSPRGRPSPAPGSRRRSRGSARRRSPPRPRRTSGPSSGRRPATRPASSALRPCSGSARRACSGDPHLIQAYLGLVRETAAIAAAHGVPVGDYTNFPIRTYVTRSGRGDRRRAQPEGLPGARGDRRRRELRVDDPGPPGRPGDRGRRRLRRPGRARRARGCGRAAAAPGARFPPWPRPRPSAGLTQDAPVPDSSRRTVLKNARLVDGAGTPPRTSVDVMLEGGKIASVGGAARRSARSRSSTSRAGRSCPGSSTATST